MSLEPDAGTRLDVLANVIANRLGRIEATFGGNPVPERDFLVQWGHTEEDDEADAIAKLVRIANKK